MVEEGPIARDRVSPGELYKKTEDGRVKCHACAHRCAIAPGKAGICGGRRNENGVLMVPYCYVCGLGADPIEKKPFYHVLPGSVTVSFGMLGCNFRCDFCQNWSTSQAHREPHGGGEVTPIEPGKIVELCKRYGSPVVTSTYNEPLITSEWSVAVFKEAKKAGIRCAFVSNGFATPEALDYLEPWLDFYKVDLKSMDDETYKRVSGGRLAPVLDTLEGILKRGMWLEVVTLVVPGLNDSDKQLAAIAGHLARLSPDIPWHVTAFHPMYKMMRAKPTSPVDLIRAYDAGKAAGLKFVYAGNVPGAVGDRENTVCPSCSRTLVKRTGFEIFSNDLSEGMCPSCQTVIPGRWS